MIRAHIATYPPRLDMLQLSLPTIASQVDQVFLCLNQFTEIPSFLAAYRNVTPVIPEKDLKDVGKFAFPAAPEDLVVMADDDLLYHPKHVKRLRRIGEELDLKRVVVGLLGTIYRRDDRDLIKGRTSLRFNEGLQERTRVHQLGSGTLLALGANIAPLEYMQGSQKFVDVRFARWLHNKGIECWAVERPDQYLREIELPGVQVETIFRTFTKRTPQHVREEIYQYLDELP